jgi:hypothetical protein
VLFDEQSEVSAARNDGMASGFSAPAVRGVAKWSNKLRTTMELIYAR